MPGSQGIALYVHVPFCLSKCPYCDFNTYQGLEHLMAPYVKAASMEVGLWGERLGHPRVRTIFFGGGTPSYIPTWGLACLLESAGTAFRVEEGAEITVEANPGDITVEKVEELRGLGVNRLSMGLQSLDDRLLRLLGRRHTALEGKQAHMMAQSGGLENVNLDLMYGLPGQTMAQWEATLAGVLDMGPSHLSLYCLTLEEGTPMEQQVRQGLLPEPDADLAADMYTKAEDVLKEGGYHHYEISNWCRPGCSSRHNQAYWWCEPYLGIGPGAHSFLDGLRFHTVRSPRKYVEMVDRWASAEKVACWGGGEEYLEGLGLVAGWERVEGAQAMAETMFLGLRLLEGVSLHGFQERHGRALLEVYGSQVEELRKTGLLEMGEGSLRLTPRGRLLANQVFMRFL